MSRRPADLGPSALEFLAERHLATLTTLRPDGSPHVVAIAFTYEPETATARVITSRTSQKARHLAHGGPVALCQVDGRHWLTLEGTGRVVTDPALVRDAEQRYARRYREPRPNPERVLLEIAVTRVLGQA